MTNDNLQNTCTYTFHFNNIFLAFSKDVGFSALLSCVRLLTCYHVPYRSVLINNIENMLAKPVA